MNRHIGRLIIGALASAALTATPLIPVVARAATPNSPTVKAAQAKKVDQLKLKVSDDGRQAMEDVHAARIALFNGDTDTARKLVHEAQQRLTRTSTDEQALGHDGQYDRNLVSIDGQLVVGHDYVATPEKTRHIVKGQAHLKAGQPQQAVEELRLADADVGYTRLLMPLKATRKHVDEAAALIYSGNNYDANLALKAAEDGLSVDTVMLVDTPHPVKTAATDTLYPIPDGSPVTID
ncbi:YfdX family protein [Nitrogeniibacter mangrovi]|uniref:YfdX family protein n=1 Tax=Nitrogeniibacter mangrovi TaxID=2016596 RepID=A0A6C1B234_9RHOO|nr:YfdX family protein [Nitrogeniibacter mangrovi]QID16410.1 YfdX family protein [Nitrogeniibacter mangrovi]